ncbi:MAG: caspase family protein, partial [Candidatus Aminicenantes bacterium]
MNLKYKVLCVGVNRVPGLKRLRFAEKDAQTTAKYFETLKNQADVTLLTGEKATRTNILDWVKECSRIQGKLTVIISFAGHGSAEKDETRKKLERC